MRQWTGSALVQIMACRLFDANYSVPSHHLNQCWVFVNWTLRNKLQWNFNQNTKFFIHKNASENIVWETAAIWSRGRWVKHQEMHGCVVSIVATDALVLKHQAISIHNADHIFIVLDQFHIKILHLWYTTLENKITFWKKWPSRLRVNKAGLQSPKEWHSLWPSNTTSHHSLGQVL